MKKLLALLILLALSFSLASCGEDEYGHDAHLHPHYELGLYYSLPDDFEQRNLSYGDLVYTNGDAYFIINYYDETTLTEDMLLHPDITPKEFAETFTLFYSTNFDKEIPYNYDPETDTATYSYVHEYDDGTESEYYTYMVFRNPQLVYQITLSCYEKDIEKYETLFERILDSVSMAG